MDTNRTQKINTAINATELVVCLKRLQLVFVLVAMMSLCGCGKDSEPIDPLWKECSAYLVKNGVDLSADDYTWYPDMCRVVHRYTHDKLTATEIMAAMDKMTDLISQGDVMEYKVFMVPAVDRVRASIRLLEMMEATKGKLKYEEKEALVAQHS